MFSTRGASDSNIQLQPTLTIPPQETLEQCSKETEFRCILFALCYFHAAVAERRRFGTQGWNRPYPFNNGDLTVSVNVLHNYLEANAKVRDKGDCFSAQHTLQQSAFLRTVTSLQHKRRLIKKPRARSSSSPAPCTLRQGKGMSTRPD